MNTGHIWGTRESMAQIIQYRFSYIALLHYTISFWDSLKVRSVESVLFRTEKLFNDDIQQYYYYYYYYYTMDSKNSDESKEIMLKVVIFEIYMIWNIKQRNCSRFKLLWNENHSTMWKCVN